jgi:hypothetical protein
MGMRWKYIMLVLPTMAGEVLLLCSALGFKNTNIWTIYFNTS